LAHLDLGRDLFVKIKTELWPVSKIERDCKMEGKRMTLVLQPEHKPAGAKPPTPGSPPAKSSAFNSGSGLNIPARQPAAAVAQATSAPQTVAS
jgi:hypothetical protein